VTEIADSSHLVSNYLWAYVARPCTTAPHLNFCKLYSAGLSKARGGLVMMIHVHRRVMVVLGLAAMISMGSQNQGKILW